ncbi:MAG: tetratricopeptide repeat protein [Bacteroidia bacterium]|nr:tetratricopeptide repeat protein [Bacteroidia bacterium]
MNLTLRHLLVMSASRFSLLVCCLMLSLTVAAQGPGKNAFMAAESLRQQNKLKEAIAKYNEALNLEPSNYKYYFQKGKCEYKLRDMESAKESFKASAEYKQNFTPAYSLLAKIYKEEKDFANAIFYYEQAVKFEADPSRRVQYQLLLINLLLVENRSDDARKHIEDARTLAPNNPNVLFYTGEIAIQDEQWEPARQAYERALASEELKDATPAEKAKYYYGLGLALSKLGDSAGAKKAWAKANFGPYQKLIAQQLTETNHIHYYKIAVGYYLNGAYDECEQHLDKSLEIQRDFSSAYVLKAKIESRSGNMDGALAEYRKAIEVEKVPARRAQYYLQTANIHANRNNYGATLTDLAAAIKEDPALTTRADLLYLRGRAEYGSGQYTAAISTLDNLMKGTTDVKTKSKYAFLLGMAAKRAGETDKAKEAFKVAMYGSYKPAAQLELAQLEGGK